MCVSICEKVFEFGDSSEVRVCGQTELQKTQSEVKGSKRKKKHP